MPEYNAKIEDFTPGDAHDVPFTVTGIPEGQALTKAWFTVKADPDNQEDAAAVVQKIVTTGASAQGQITDDGSGTGLGSVQGTAHGVFHLLPADTAPLGVPHYFDIQVLPAVGKPTTPFSGMIRGMGKNVTRATS